MVHLLNSSSVGPSPAIASSSSHSLSPESAAASTSNGTSSSTPTEYCVLFMGTWHKQPLFVQLQMAAQRFEQHIQYADTSYLTFEFGQETIVLELIDPGTEHTGAREMAIRKADAAILCYAAYSPASFHTLASIADDFKCLEEGRQPVSLLICNEDQLLEHSEPEDGERTDGSEGYGSASNSPPEEEEPPTMSPRRRKSMERIRRAREEGECPINREQGEQLAHQFGPNIEFLNVSFSPSVPELPQIVHQLIQRVKECRLHRQRARSRSGSRHLSPMLPLMRKTSSLKKLLTYSKSDAEQLNKEAAANGQKASPAKRLSHPPISTSTTDLASTGSTGSEGGGGGGRGGGGIGRKMHLFGNALRVMVNPRERTKSQNKVAAARESDMNQGMSDGHSPINGHKTTDFPVLQTPVERTPFGLEVIPPTGEPCTEPFEFTTANGNCNGNEPVRVNNFVGEEEEAGQQQLPNGMPQKRGGSLAGQQQQQQLQPVGNSLKKRLRAATSPASSAACTIQ